MAQYEIITHGHRAQLGEGILWSARSNAVYWVDLMAPAVHRMVLGETTVGSWPMPDLIGWVVERQHRPGFIAGFAGGFAELTLDPMLIRPIGDPEPDLPNNRMNDAVVDPAGHLWAGTMDGDAAVPVGCLYRLDANHSWRKMDDGYLVPNGPAFSPDGRYLYHADTLRRVIYRFEVGPDAGLVNKQSWVVFPEDWGMPDGMTIDAEGCLWVGHWGGSRISRFSPAGKIERVVTLPVSQVTNCAFVGAALDRLFVTTAACDRPDEELAGELFEVDAGVRGLAPILFCG